MSYEYFLPLTLIILFIIFIIFLYYINKNKNEKPRDHDHLKKKHPTEESALKEIIRMQKKELPECEKLNAYYNPKYKAWFVGKSKYTMI